jgi:hypothetical protein
MLGGVLGMVRQDRGLWIVAENGRSLPDRSGSAKQTKCDD